MTGSALITRHLTQQCIVQLEDFDSVEEATRMALEASDGITRWLEVDPEVFVKVQVDVEGTK